MNIRNILIIMVVCLTVVVALFIGLAPKSSTSILVSDNKEIEGVKQIMGRKNNKKILIAYYSWSNNTKFVAEEIHKQIGGDLRFIEPQNTYSDIYAVTVAKAKIEQFNNSRPTIKTTIPNIDEYDIIFLGYPNWWGSYPMLIATFAEKHKLDGKVIVPFYTHGGGGEQRCLSDLRKLLPKAKIADGLCLHGKQVKSSQDEINNWLKNLGF